MAGEAEPVDLTELAGVAEMGTEQVEAWALDVEDYPLTGSWEDPERKLTPKRITLLAVVASVTAVGAVGGFAAWKLRDQEPGVHTTHVVIATATATVTHIVTPPSRLTAPSPEQKPRMPSLAIFDDALINNLRHRGWTIRDEANAIDQGHLACDLLRRGKSPAEVISRMENGTPPSTPSDARSFLSAAMATYPNCP